ncbi:MAG: long-chain-fatty-acid--CoA ligase [Pelosinus sp.]|nr:long-chain-fatty-acid--CoA ligase [Pelosinus sp.]
MLVHELIYRGKDTDIALIDKEPITYLQLQKKVELYRNYFYQQGVRSGENVGLLAKNSAEFIYVYMAIASLGAVVVPINFLLAAREVAFILKDGNIKTLVTMKELDLAQELQKNGCPHQVTQEVISEIECSLAETVYPPAPVPEAFDENELCVIIYTSGTTGHPKGAMLTHHNLLADAMAYSQTFSFMPSDKVFCVLPMYHCFSWTCCVLTALFNGNSITILDSFSIREAIAAISKGELTVIYGVPTMYKLYAAWGKPEDFAKVRIFVSGGAALPQEILAQFALRTGRQIVEGYGLSEASPVVALNPVEKVKPGSIGKPLPGITAKIAGNDGQWLKTGEVGELVISGPIVMKGYYNLPEATAEALRGGCLHTGDLAYIDEEGYIFIVDRLKDMIITSGENIYPREIEELLFSHPAVSEAAVVGIPDKLRGQSAYAFVVLKEGSSADKRTLRDYLRSNLAAYKVPRDFLFIDDLPKNATGKVMKTTLREVLLKKV